MLSEMILPLVAHLMGESLEQFEVAGVGEEMPRVQADLVLARLSIARHVAEMFVVSEILALVLEGEDAAGKPAGKQFLVNPVVAFRKSDVVPDMLVAAHP